jgi:serine/threonine-protein kinase RsbW
MTNSHQWTCDRTLTSSLENGCELIREFVEQLQKAGWEESESFGVHLAFEEALMNAIKHGNKLDPKKLVKVKITLSATAVDVSIEDEGPGFDPDSLPDPTDSENIDSISGRGVMLIRHFMDEVYFNPCGNRVTMRKSK